MSSAEQYIEFARGFARIEGSDEALRRSAALMARTAVEFALRDYWMAANRAVTLSNTTIQLTCLRSVVNEEVGARTEYAWRTLSDLCHYRVYQVTPLLSEINNAIDRAQLAIQGLRSLPTQY